MKLSEPLFRGQHQHRLANLIVSVAANKLRVSQFQRGNIWSLEKRATLVDSIVRGYPIGTLTVWRAAPDDVRALGELNDGNWCVDYILDGHERIASVLDERIHFDLAHEGEGTAIRTSPTSPSCVLLSKMLGDIYEIDHERERVFALLGRAASNRFASLRNVLRDYPMFVFDVVGPDVQGARELAARLNGG